MSIGTNEEACHEDSLGEHIASFIHRRGDIESDIVRGYFSNDVAHSVDVQES